MSVPFWAAELAARFWEEAGGAEPFPRRLSGAIRRALPLSVVYLGGLSIRRVAAWLQEAGVAWPLRVADRPLRACLVARGGSGVAFVDADDPEDERRFSLAHELAHFLRHYRQPRRLACRRLGAHMAEVFDGERPPTTAERCHALLAGVPLGHHVHLMGRGPGGGAAAVAAAEREADLLAYELLAPAGDILARLREAGGASDRAALVRALPQLFGLPAGPAEAYAALLLPAPREDPLLARLRRLK